MKLNILPRKLLECEIPKLWIGEIIESGEENYANWLKRSQSLYYQNQNQKFSAIKNFENLFTIKGESPRNP